MEKARKDGKNGVGQNLADYEPTPKERNLLEVLLNPESRMWSKTEICRKAGCDRQTYYNTYAKPEFVDYVMKQSLALVKQGVPATVNAVLRQAKRGDSTHAKMILMMAGLYAEKSDQTVKQVAVLKMERHYSHKPIKEENE